MASISHYLVIIDNMAEWLANIYKWCIMELLVIKVDKSGEKLGQKWITLNITPTLYLWAREK
jgi:hypothetical protein